MILYRFHSDSVCGIINFSSYLGIDFFFGIIIKLVELQAVKQFRLTAERMDDFGSSSFFDYQLHTQSSLTPGIDMIGSNIETSVKQESFDPGSVWIQGFPDVGGTSLQNGSFQPIKNDFIESLISDSDISHTPSPVTDPLDPLDMILNPVTTELAMTTAQPTAKLDPDEALLHALNAASSQPVSQNLHTKYTNGQTENAKVEEEQVEQRSESQSNEENGDVEGTKVIILIDSGG